jgi:hypothetical protein
MINHNIQSMNLDQFDEGEISLPSETKAETFHSNLRQFIILTRRAFNESALHDMAQTEGIKTSTHNPHGDTEPYFGITLQVSPHFGKIEDFLEVHGDTFFDSLTRISSTSVQRGVSGKRAAFVREFRRASSFNNTIETQLVLSTSVFYNDYRVTTGFPSTLSEIEDSARSIMERLHQEWGDKVRFELETHEAPYEETDSGF